MDLFFAILEFRIQGCWIFPSRWFWVLYQHRLDDNRWLHWQCLIISWAIGYPTKHGLLGLSMKLVQGAVSASSDRWWLPDDSACCVGNDSYHFNYGWVGLVRNNKFSKLGSIRVQVQRANWQPGWRWRLSRHNSCSDIVFSCWWLVWRELQPNSSKSICKLSFSGEIDSCWQYSVLNPVVGKFEMFSQLENISAPTNSSGNHMFAGYLEWELQF